MAKLGYIHINSKKQGSCGILSSKTDSLEICDESPPFFHAGNVIKKNKYNDCKVTYTDNSDSGCGTGSDDDSLPSLEQSNSPETSENLDSNNFFDFWNTFSQANEGSFNSNEIHSLNLKGSVSKSSNDSLSNNEEPDMTLADLLSIDVENSSSSSNSKCSSTVGCVKFSSATNIIREKSNFETNQDDNLKTWDSFKYINAREENDSTHKFTLHNSINAIDNIYSNINSDATKSSDTSNSDAPLSDLLASVNFDDNESSKHYNLLNPGFSIKDEHDNTSISESNFGYSKDSNTSCLFTDNSDLCLSDILASISFEEETCNKNCASDLMCSNIESNEKSDVIKQVDNNSEQKILNNLLQNQDPTEKASEEVSLAALAEKHLVSTQAANLGSHENEVGEVSLAALSEKHLASNLGSHENGAGEVSSAALVENHLASPEKEIGEVSLAALAKKHLSLMKVSSPSNQITDESPSMSPCSYETINHESFVELLTNFEPSAELKPTRTESENIDNDLSMLELLSSLNIKEICPEDEYCNKNSASYQFDETTSENTNFITDETIMENKPDFLEVDLTTCLKSTAEPSSMPSKNASKVKKDEVDHFTESFNLSAFHYSPVLSLSPNANLVSTNTNAVKCKVNQSLFAKALSCKPRKNISAMYKVLDLKMNMCNHFFQPLVTVPSKNLTKQAKTAFIDQTNCCVTMSCGIRSFGS